MTEQERQPQEAGWTEALGEHASNPPNPRTSGDTLFALGREWKVASLENRIKAQFEQWVRRGAKQAVTEADAEDGPEEAAKMREAYQAAWGAGHYTWDGKHCRSARGDLPGLRQLLYLLIARCHPDVTQELVTEMFEKHPRECGMAIGWALGNRQAPAKEPGTKETETTTSR